MPVLPNPRHEVFAQELAKGKPACEAYEVAGYNPARSSAARLARNADICARVDELLATREQIHAQATQQAVERTALTKEWVIQGLMENAQRALQRQAVLDDEGKPIGEYHYQGQVANRAFELLGKELGMFIERRETGAPGEFAGIDGMTAEELKAFVAQRPLPVRPDPETDKSLN